MAESQISKPFKAHYLIGRAAGIRGVRTEMANVNGANAKIAVFFTNIVGSMWCAYLFAGIALLGLRPALRPGGEGCALWRNPEDLTPRQRASSPGSQGEHQALPGLPDERAAAPGYQEEGGARPHHVGRLAGDPGPAPDGLRDCQTRASDRTRPARPRWLLPASARSSRSMIDPVELSALALASLA